MKTFATSLLAAVLLAAVGRAQTTVLPGGELPLNSVGANDIAVSTFATNGFAGAYIRVEKAAEVQITVNASGKLSPRMNVVIANTKTGFDVADEPKDFAIKQSLVPGVYFVRIEHVNANRREGKQLNIHSLRVDNAVLLRDDTDANALAAADTYINVYRRGPVTLVLPGVAEGTPVRVRLARHAFNFGVVASGTMTNTNFIDNPPAGSEAWRVQQFTKENFNAVVPGNSGKWAHNEEVRGTITMGLADAITRFAKANNMRVRMHTLLWDTNQQPNWASDLLEKALNKDEAAKIELRKAVGERMEYYLTQRGKDYFEIDGLNEPYHRPRWWQAFGAEGIAEIHNAAADAVARGGGTAPIFVNEYNVFQWSSNPLTRGGLDPYANWYREYVEALINAGGKVGGIGIQYYARTGPGERRGNPHSPSRIAAVFHNLSITGLPISLTEFGVQSVGNPSHTDAAKILEDSVRMSFGTAGVNTFMVWGFWESEMWDQADRAAMLDKNWNLLAPGRTWKSLMAEWNTDLTAFTNASGEITFTGFFGDYEITAGEKTFRFTHSADVARRELKSD